MHLGVAERELLEAHSLARSGKSEEASFVVDGARTDAELALMVTRQLQARNEAERATEVVRSLASSDERGGAP